MELSDNTLSILKNFSGINQNILIRSGNTIKTISEARNVLARADVVEEFPQDFGVYDLNEFIGVLGLVDTPNLQFAEEFVKVGDSSGRSKVKYFFSSEETLTTPQKDITMPEADVSFKLDNDTLNRIKKAASTLGHSEVSIKPGNGVLTLSVLDSKNSTSNAFEIDIDGEYAEGTEFNFILSIGNLKISNTNVPVKYWIALEKSSTFGA